jgi:YHS domain-containing protein
MAMTRAWGRLAASVVGIVVTASAAAYADEARWYVSRGQPALGGHDAVAYFTESKAVRGSAEFEVEWSGARWRFASAASRDAFLKEPEKYAPQFGGYCAWAVSQGYTASGDPEAWTVVDGKLYINYSRSVRRSWERDATGNIRKGEANWPGVLKK